MKSLNFNDIVGANDLKLTEVEVPEWGGVVYLRPMTAKDRDYYENLMFNMRSTNQSKRNDIWSGLRCRVLAATMTDADGRLLFDQKDQWKLLSGKNTVVIVRLFELAMSLSGMGAAGEEKSEEVLPTTDGPDLNSNLQEISV